MHFNIKMLEEGKEKGHPKGLIIYKGNENSAD